MLLRKAPKSRSGRFGGPYNIDQGVVLSPGGGKDQPWEGLQGSDSISPPFRTASGVLTAFYGSAHTELPANPPRFARPNMWNVGLATMASAGAPLARVKPSALVDFNGGGAENPIVTVIDAATAGDGKPLYVVVYDDLHAEAAGFGVACSEDGLRWGPPGGAVAAIPGGARTPQGLFVDGAARGGAIPVGVLFSAGHPERPWRAAMKLDVASCRAAAEAAAAA